MRKIQLGLIGANPELRSGALVKGLDRERASITAVADTDPAMLQAYAALHPEEQPLLTGDVGELFACPEIDGVIIVVRDCFHEELAIRALEAGKAVFLEKPMAITVEGCDRILEAAYRTKSKLFLGHNMRYMPFVRKMKELIDGGAIGELQAVWCRHFVGYGSCYFRHWCAERKNCTGLLLQKGAHDIDVIHWLAGAPARRVVAMGKLSVYNRTLDRLAPGEQPDRKISFTNEAWPPLSLTGLAAEIDVEDHNMLMMELGNGVQATYMHCMYTPDSGRNYTFIGTEGRIENIGNGEPGTRVLLWNKRGSGAPDEVFELPVIEGSHGGSDPLLVQAFVDFVADGKTPDTSPVDARDAVAAGVLGHYSARNGNIPCQVPPLRQELVDYFTNGQR